MIKVEAHLFSFQNFVDVIYNNQKIELNDEVLCKCKKSNTFLKNFIKGKIIYGINTGLGPMAQYKIEESEQINLQKNLIRSHSAGVGQHMDAAFVKGAMLCRLINFSKGYSGVSIETLNTLQSFINHNIIPVVSEHGGVGASGDLVQLSQIALCLIGEGEVYYEGKLFKTKEILNTLGIKPLEIDLREGLALINGTSFMTSVGLCNLYNSKKALDFAVLNGCLINEMVESFDDHFSIELNHVKLHVNQQNIAEKMRTILIDSQLIQKRHNTYYKNANEDEKVFAKKVQEYYSLRCLPQILGPIEKSIQDTEDLLLNEMNSVSDNPIIDTETENIYHGGNFHGDFVSAEMNKLKNAIIKLSVLTERQLNFLLNHNLNKEFPPFLNLGTLGLNLGLQGAQYAATSTTAENQNFSSSMYVHSIPSNNDNQDVVSMGTNEALLCKKVIDNFYIINSVFCLAILYTTVLKNKNNLLSLKTRNFVNNLTQLIEINTNDEEIRTKLEKIEEYLKTN